MSEADDPWGATKPVTGWRAAPDCARCNDTGRYTELHCRADALVRDCEACTDMTKPLHLRRAFDHTGHTNHRLATFAGHCDCKRGRRMSELWYADKHGLHHPDAPEPSQDPELYYEESEA